MQKPIIWFTLLPLMLLLSFANAGQQPDHQLNGQQLNGQQLNGQQLNGKWRGKLQITPQAALVLGINISGSPQQYSLTLDSPNQGMFDYQPTTFSIDGNNVQFQDDKLSASFSGTMQNGKLTGEFNQGKTLPLSLSKLDSTQQQQLANEGSWFGDLIINDSARLPLVLNIAVASDGYYVTLDSPKQQSFGIPVEQFSVSAETLEFASGMINASYSATWQDDSWQGTFVQGSAMPLVLKKKPN